MRRLAAWLIVSAVLVGAPATARAQVSAIGANMARPANAVNTCRELPSTNAFGNRAFVAPVFARPGASCTYLGVGAPLNPQAEIAAAPGPGVVTAVRVKTGPSVGPMIATVLDSLRGGTGFACCFHAGQSRVFTPAPNAVTTVPVRLPMRFEFNQASGERRAYLGLTVLSLDVPIPAHDTGTNNDLASPGALAFFAGVEPGQERADGAGVSGYVPLMAATFQRLCTGATLIAAARAAQAAGCAGRAQLASGSVPVRRGRARFTVVCNLPGGCRGTARVQTRSALRRGRRATLARSSFRIAAGGRDTVAPRLTRAGRRRLSGRRRLRAFANVRVGKAPVAVQRVTLRR